MIDDPERAKEVAEILVREFLQQNKDTIERNRKNGDSLGVMKGKPLYNKLVAVREGYLWNVSHEIKTLHNFFNQAVIDIILKPHVKVIPCEDDERLDEQGIHLLRPDAEEIEQAKEDAERKGFERVYVHY